MNQSKVALAEREAHYFVRLRTCAVISFVLLGASAVMHVPHWVGMLGGIAPLVYYHIGYLAPRASKGLSTAAIDSVYYFGFLVTIAALGMSAVSLAMTEGKASLDGIAFQFGLGLLATGYAILARMHLNAISVGVDETSPEEVLDRYVQRSKELVVNMELAATSYAQLSATTIQKTQEVADLARQAAEKSMRDAAKVFSEQLRESLFGAKAGVTEVRALVSELSFVEERKQLVHSVKETLEVLNALNHALRDFSTKTGEISEANRSGAVVQSALNANLADFGDRLAAVGGPEGLLAVTAKHLKESQSAVAEGAASMAEAVQELGTIAGTVSGIAPTFKSIRTLTLKAHEQLDLLAASTERLGNATGHLASTASLTEGLADGVERVTNVLPGLAEQAAALEAKLGSLSTTAGAVEHQLDGLPRPAEEAVRAGESLREALHAVAGAVSRVSEGAGQLASHGASQAANMQQAQGLAADATRAVDETQKSLKALALTVQKLDSDLKGSAEALKTALDSVSTSLEGQVKRSGDVAQLFGERMTDVAQIIIDRTRASRATTL